MGMMIAVLHVFGKIFSSYILLKVCNIIFVMVLWMCLIIEYVISSFPGAASETCDNACFNSGIVNGSL